jgi:hypothetical protein
VHLRAWLIDIYPREGAGLLMKQVVQLGVRRAHGDEGRRVGVLGNGLYPLLRLTPRDIGDGNSDDASQQAGIEGDDKV